MKNTGVFATKEEMDYIMGKVNIPVMLIGDVDISRPTAQEVAHKCALRMPPVAELGRRKRNVRCRTKADKGEYNGLP